MAGQLPLLMPYLACGNESIRCAIVHILGALLAEVFAEAVRARRLKRERKH